MMFAKRYRKVIFMLNLLFLFANVISMICNYYSGITHGDIISIRFYSLTSFHLILFLSVNGVHIVILFSSSVFLVPVCHIGINRSAKGIETDHFVVKQLALVLSRSNHTIEIRRKIERTVFAVTIRSEK